MEETDFLNSAVDYSEEQLQRNWGIQSNALLLLQCSPQYPEYTHGTHSQCVLSPYLHVDLTVCYSKELTCDVSCSCASVRLISSWDMTWQQMHDLNITCMFSFPPWTNGLPVGPTPGSPGLHLYLSLVKEQPAQKKRGNETALCGFSR